MKLKWKKKYVSVPVCPKCDHELSGNNSKVLPYRCIEHGEWISTVDPSDFILNKLNDD